ncbi:MAG: hypothetical protein COW03_16330 [Cytophagales bacterium CG12_big_fil_rev_8_21_14_0_65_40_12]|nr:MAG: hypothetical protein COW03_16330 [Cytophagales bacterium CG12_big_fil_rev_8_21_14_0_65_40_12]
MFCLGASAQEENIVLKGEIVDARSQEPVLFASVLVINKNKGIASDTDGKFEFPVNYQDKIKITSIGYEPIEFTITEQLIAQHPTGLYIQMKPSVRELDSVVVTGLSENFYLRRKQGVPIDLGFVDPKTPKRDWTKPQAGFENGGFVISGLLSSLDKKVKEKRQLNKLLAAIEEEQARKNKAEAKFNREFVKAVTRIDDRVIAEFIEFCNFYETEIIQSSEYELTQKILKKYNEFLRR